MAPTAWCHLRKGLRSFSVDAIQAAQPTDKKARNVSERKLNEIYRAGYGIFSGKSTHKAVLRFTQERARWVSREIWHSEQESFLPAIKNHVSDKLQDVIPRRVRSLSIWTGLHRPH